MSNIVLGTMNISYPYSSNKFDSSSNNNLDSYKSILETYLNKMKKKSILDTAYYYGNTTTEKILGELLLDMPFIPKIATKVNPWFNNDFTNGKLGQLNKDGIEKQLNTSLINLKQDKIDILYLHCFDYETCLKETLETCDTLWRKDKFDYFGVSNFSLTQTKEVIDISEKYDYNPITYYQGMYNLISRKVEEIFPLLNEHDIEFWGYNPLAGGLLTGKYKEYKNTEEIAENSRFKDNKIYQSIFWKPEILKNLKDFFTLDKEECIKYSLKWLQNGSKMNQSDKIILGVSTMDQLNTCLNILDDKTTLDKKWDQLYEPIANFSPNYWY